MKPLIESVLNQNDFDWLVRENSCGVRKPEVSCPWHYHTEFELVLYRDPNGVFSGSYFAADTIAPITHNTLLLYGPGMPHMLSGKLSSGKEGTLDTLILWFRPQWLESLVATIPELKPLTSLLHAQYGLSSRPETAESIYALLSKHEKKNPHQQFLSVLEALITLAEDHQAQRISSTPSTFSQLANDDTALERVELARSFIEMNYSSAIKITDLCQHIHLSESSTYRLFEKHFNESFSEHLKRFRTGKACELLVNSKYSIALIAEKTGFNNLSNFNRQFKAVKGMTPSEFRGRFR